MTTLAETQAHPPRISHLRTYLVGTGATGALIAGAVIVLLSLATYVAFTGGMPFAGNADSSGTTNIGVQTSGTPAAAAAALGAAPGAVAAAPVPGALIGAGGPGAGGAGGGGAGGPGNGGGFTPGGGPGSSGSTPPGSTPGGPSPGGGPVPCSTCDSPGITGNAINQIDNTAGTNLSGGPAGSVAGTVDKTVTGTGNKVGGAVGQPGLGDTATGDVNGTVNHVTGGLPGGGKPKIP